MDTNDHNALRLTLVIAAAHRARRLLAPHSLRLSGRRATQARGPPVRRSGPSGYAGRLATGRRAGAGSACLWWPSLATGTLRQCVAAMTAMAPAAPCASRSRRRGASARQRPRPGKSMAGSTRGAARRYCRAAGCQHVPWAADDLTASTRPLIAEPRTCAARSTSRHGQSRRASTGDWWISRSGRLVSLPLPPHRPHRATKATTLAMMTRARTLWISAWNAVSRRQRRWPVPGRRWPSIAASCQ